MILLVIIKNRISEFQEDCLYNSYYQVEHLVKLWNRESHESWIIDGHWPIREAVNENWQNLGLSPKPVDPPSQVHLGFFTQFYRSKVRFQGQKQWPPKFHIIFRTPGRTPPYLELSLKFYFDKIWNETSSGWPTLEKACTDHSCWRWASKLLFVFFCRCLDFEAIQRPQKQLHKNFLRLHIPQWFVLKNNYPI